jgi:NAD(P) transhydrogenase subunit alpha
MLSVYLIGLYVFVLSCFVGYEVISKVPPLLHTPLMSGTNAISGISLVGAVIAAGHGSDTLTVVLGTVAIVCGTVNVVGGYLVTHRMLRMFKRK